MSQGSSFPSLRKFVQRTAFKKGPQIFKRLKAVLPGRLDEAVSMSEYIPQELSVPSGLLLKSQFFLPGTKGRIAFSQALLSRVRYGLPLPPGAGEELVCGDGAVRGARARRGGGACGGGRSGVKRLRGNILEVRRKDREGFIDRTDPPG
jgi:hypothetical protein